MIFRHITRLLSCGLPNAITQGLNFLRSTDFTALPAGKIDIGVDNMFSRILDSATTPAEENKYGDHSSYPEIQFLVRGYERIDLTLRSVKNNILRIPSADKNIVFYSVVENDPLLPPEPASVATFPGGYSPPGQCPTQPHRDKKDER